MHELLKLFTQDKLGDNDSAGDAEEYEREPETVVFADALFVLLAMLFWSLAVKIWLD